RDAPHAHRDPTRPLGERAGAPPAGALGVQRHPAGARLAKARGRRDPLRHRPRGRERRDVGPQGARHPHRWLHRPRGDRHGALALRGPRGGGGQGRGRRRRRVGGGRGAQRGERGALGGLPVVHDPRRPHRVGGDLPRLRHPGRRRDGGRTRVRPDRGVLRRDGAEARAARPPLVRRARRGLPRRDHRGPRSVLGLPGNRCHAGHVQPGGPRALQRDRQPGLLRVLRGRVRGRRGDAVPDDVEVRRAHRGPHLGHDDPGGGEHRRVGRLRRLGSVAGVDGPARDQPRRHPPRGDVHALRPAPRVPAPPAPPPLRHEPQGGRPPARPLPALGARAVLGEL
ncbi:MAG: hypothetical protein AVDCRST_MAG30-696, partial [uncultured Solirubrobacteraceae bacterium]